MTYIAKVNPDDFDIAQFKIILPAKGDRDIPQGEEIFIWTSETLGGRGLTARGVSAHTVTTNDAELVFSSLMILPTGVYGIADLEHLRDTRDDTLMSFLAEKFYYHSHRRVLSVPSVLATELRERFLNRFGAL